MKLNITGPDFILSLEDIPEEFREHWPTSGGGDATEHCRYILGNFDIECSDEDAKAFLRPYGAWDDEDLLDHGENMLRLVWLICCDLGESGEAHLSTY